MLSVEKHVEICAKGFSELPPAVALEGFPVVGLDPRKDVHDADLVSLELQRQGALAKYTVIKNLNVYDHTSVTRLDRSY